MIKQAIVSILLLCLMILAGCSIPISSNSTDLPNPTHIYQTISAGLTGTAIISGLPSQTQPAFTLTSPTSTILYTLPVNPSASAILYPTKTITPSIPCNRAASGKPAIDVSIPDGTRLKPGESFTKTWRLVNEGECSWSTNYAFVWFSGESFSSATAQNFTSEVDQGSTIDVSVDMVAPNDPGIHQSNWKLRAENGILFGLGPEGDAPFWVRIEVVNDSTPSLITAETITPTPVIARHDIIILSLNSAIDLDSGTINSGSGDDLGLIADASGSTSLLPLNGARSVIYGSQTASESDCATLSLSGTGIPVSTLAEKPVICYRTNQGLLGMGRLSSIKEKSLSLDYTTWMVP